MASSSELSPLAPMGNADNFGTRLLPSILDKYAIDEPSRVYACLARSAEVAEGFEEISMRQLASAVDALAWRISNEMGDSKDFSTLAFFAPSDIRYPLMIFAAAKCQRKVSLRILLHDI